MAYQYEPKELDRLHKAYVKAREAWHDSGWQDHQLETKYIRARTKWKRAWGINE